MRTSSVALALGCLTLASACSSPEPGRLGVVLSPDGMQGARLALEDVNASGGIGGQPLRVRIMEAAYSASAALAIAAAESLSIDGRIVGVIGHSNSSATLAASQIYNARHLPHLAPTSSAPMLADAGRYTYQMVASDVHQAQFLTDVLTRDGRRPRVALLFVNDDYGRGLQQALRRRLAQRGVEITYEAPVAELDRFVDGELAAVAVAKTRPEVLVWVGRAGPLGKLLPHLRRSMPGVQVLASDGWEDAVSARNADGVFTGVRYVRFIPPTAGDPRLARLRERFRRRAPQIEMTTQAVLSYDAVMLYAAALRAGVRSREGVRDYLESIGKDRPSFEGLGGRLTFDATGAGSARYVLTEVTATGLRALPPPLTR